MKILEKDKLHLFRKWVSVAPALAAIPIFWRNPSEQVIVFMCLMSVYFYFCVAAPQKAIDYAKLGAQISPPQEAVMVLLSLVATYAAMAVGFAKLPFASAIFLAPGMGAAWGCLAVALSLAVVKVWEWA
jgi:hypothetical protein